MSIEGYGGETPNYEDTVADELADLDAALGSLTGQELSVTEDTAEAASLAEFASTIDKTFLQTLHQFEPVTLDQFFRRMLNL